MTKWELCPSQQFQLVIAIGESQQCWQIIQNLKKENNTKTFWFCRGYVGSYRLNSSHPGKCQSEWVGAKILQAMWTTCALTYKKQHDV